MILPCISGEFGVGRYRLILLCVFGVSLGMGWYSSDSFRLLDVGLGAVYVCWTLI